MIARRRTTALAAVAAAIALSGCANTLLPDAEAEEADVVATTFVPTGTPDELLDQLVDQSRRLSELIVDNEGDDELLARIDATWKAVRGDIEAADIGILDRFDRSIAMLHTGVDRRRPADADKASRNLEALVAGLEL